MQNYRYFLLLFLLLASYVARTQNFPVQSTVQLVPPYSVYLPDYTVPGNDKLRVILLQRDLTQSNYQLRLFFSIILNGRVIMRTSRNFNPPPIQVNAGVPTIISGAELTPYLDSRNLDFIGYSRDLYEKTKTLPEGSFQICATAYDYTRQEVQVSNQGCSFYYLAKNEPPLINLPACGSKIPHREPQQIVFSWMPRNTSSPNSAITTEYEFNLYEIRIPGRNPNDVVLNTPPVYSTITNFSQLVYGPADPPLTENMQYVWRVQARDREGRDMFRNNGFTEVCTFTYGGADQNIQVGMVKDFKANAINEKRANIAWTKEEDVFDSYKIFYKKTGTQQDWFNQESSDEQITINGLEPNTEYEARIQGKRRGFYGGYSDIVKFTTPAKKVYQCGDTVKISKYTDSKPVDILTKGMTLNARGMDVILTEVQPLGDGWFKGKGMVAVDFLAGASFNVTFDRIFVDTAKNVINGKIILPTRGINQMEAEQLEKQKDKKLKKQQQENRNKYDQEGVVFYEEVFLYNDIAIADVKVQEDGKVIITDQDGKTYTNTTIGPSRASNPDKAIIIEDKNGDQVVIKKDGTVEKVPGGGLSGGANSGVNEISEAVAKLNKITLPLLKGILNDIKTSNSFKIDSNKTSYQNILKDYNNNYQQLKPSVSINLPQGEGGSIGGVDIIELEIREEKLFRYFESKNEQSEYKVLNSSIDSLKSIELQIKVNELIESKINTYLGNPNLDPAAKYILESLKKADSKSIDLYLKEEDEYKIFLKETIIQEIDKEVFKELALE